MEQELQRLILDIHDGVIQKLFAASSQLALLQAQLESQAPEVRADLEPVLLRSMTLVDYALQDIRTTLSSARNTEFQEHELPDILYNLSQEHEHLTAHVVDFQITSPFPEVSLPVKIALYRVLQEALSNAYRHSGADQATVRLGQQADLITLEIRDQGQGFELAPGSINMPAHIGLSGMCERIELVGGRIQLTSAVGQGTCIIVQVPYDS